MKMKVCKTLPKIHLIVLKKYLITPNLIAACFHVHFSVCMQSYGIRLGIKVYDGTSYIVYLQSTYLNPSWLSK